MSVAEIWDWAYRLLLAGGLGALVGTEREIRGHAAGVRTQALVAMASALLTAVGTTAFSGPAADPTRIASQVVTGIGFIGAGVILKHRGTVRGLTTAATLWVSAALGVAVGAGMVIPAILGAVSALVFIYGLRLVKPLIRRSGRRTVHVEYVQGHGTIGPLLRSLQGIGSTVEDLDIDDETDGPGEPMRHVRIRITTPDQSELESAILALLQRPEVHDIRVVDN